MLNDKMFTRRNNPEPANLETTNTDNFTSFRLKPVFPSLPDRIREAVKSNYEKGFGIIIHGWQDSKSSPFNINHKGMPKPI